MTEVRMGHELKVLRIGIELPVNKTWFKQLNQCKNQTVVVRTISQLIKENSHI